MPEPILPLVVLTRLLEVDDALRASGVGYSFGGAIALAYHVERPRGTADIDVNLAVVAEEVPPLLDALPVESWDGRAIDHLAQEGWVRLRMPGGVPLDLFVPQHRFHDDLQEHALPLPFGDREIPIVSATHLTVLKTMFGRGKDWIDIASMVEAGSVDGEAALAWTAELLGEDSPGHQRLGEVLATTPRR